MLAGRVLPGVEDLLDSGGVDADRSSLLDDGVDISLLCFCYFYFYFYFYSV